MIEELIFTLNDKYNYRMLSNLTFEGKVYCFCVLLDDKDEDTDEYVFFEKKGKDKLIKVVDNSLIEQLLVLFTGKYTEFVYSVSGDDNV